jgi:hypothetical protein
LHAGLGALLLLRATTVPLLLYAVLTPLEYVVLAGYLGFFLNSEAD